MVVSLRVIVDICVGAIMLRQQLMELVQVGQQRWGNGDFVHFWVVIDVSEAPLEAPLGPPWSGGRSESLFAVGLSLKVSTPDDNHVVGEANGEELVHFANRWIAIWCQQQLWVYVIRRFANRG